MMCDFWTWLSSAARRQAAPPDFLPLHEDDRGRVDRSVVQSYDQAFREALERLIARTQDATLRRTFEDMRDCPIGDGKGRCRGFADYILGALIKNGLHRTYDLEASLQYVAEKMLLVRSPETGARRATVFDDFDETRPYAAGDNPLQARFLSWVRLAVNNIGKGAIRRLANVEPRPQGTVSIVPGRARKGERLGGVAADDIPARPSDDRSFEEMLADIEALLRRKEVAAGLPLAAMLRAMLAGQGVKQRRRAFGDRAAREGRQIILLAVEDYARSTQNILLLHLLGHLRGDGAEGASLTRGKPTKAVRSEKERDYGSIVSVVARFDRPVGSADLGRFRRRWLEYPPRNLASGYRNRLEEVLAAMVADGVLPAPGRGPGPWCTVVGRISTSSA